MRDRGGYNIDEEIGGVQVRRAHVSQRVEIRKGLVGGTHVDGLSSLAKQEQIITKLEDLETRLMKDSNDGNSSSSNVVQAGNDLLGTGSVQTSRGLIQEQH